jgi:two-component system OmpR family sensor kinase
MRILHSIRTCIIRIPIRLRLTLVSLGLLTILLGSLGIVILITAEKALYIRAAVDLRNDARLATNDIKAHPPQSSTKNFDPTATLLPSEHFNPTTAPLSPQFTSRAAIITQKLVSSTDDAIIFSCQGKFIASGNDPPFTPAHVKLSLAQIQRLANNQQDANDYLITNDVQGQRQLVVIISLAQQNHTLALLQISTPTQDTDDFITTLRLVLLIGGIGALSLAAAVTFPLIAAALYPLVEMERTSRRIADGELWLRLNTALPNDEIGDLAESFNQMVARLEKAFQQQERFVANVSHELRTPLTALSGSLEMLLIGADNGDIATTRRLTRGMYAEIQRMHRLVEDLLVLARLDENRIALREDHINLAEIVTRVYDQAQQLAHGQYITYDVNTHALCARADTDKLLQVLLIIIDNALKFTTTYGQIEILAYNEGQEIIIIEVRDNGRGIPKNDLPHVFERFYRVDQARSRQPQQVGGNGLGLAIAKELIEAQGGTIMLNSDITAGTTVTLRLRAVPSTDTPQLSQASKH